MTEQKNSGLTVREAGKLGGDKLFKKYGRAHMSEMGKKGSDAVKKKLGREHYQRAGRAGGLKRAELLRAKEKTDGASREDPSSSN